MQSSVAGASPAAIGENASVGAVKHAHPVGGADVVVAVSAGLSASRLCELPGAGSEVQLASLTGSSGEDSARNNQEDGVSGLHPAGFRTHDDVKTYISFV